MVRERTGYRTLNRTRMFTGSGQPLFSKVQSFNMELRSCCSPYRLSTVAEPQRERSDRGAHTFTGITPTAPRCSDWRQRWGKKFWARGEIFKYVSSSRLQGRRTKDVTSLDGFRGVSINLSVYLSIYPVNAMTLHVTLSGFWWPSCSPSAFVHLSCERKRRKKSVLCSSVPISFTITMHSRFYQTLVHVCKLTFLISSQMCMGGDDGTMMVLFCKNLLR